MRDPWAAVIRIKFGSKEARDTAVATGMTDGMEQSYELLDRLLIEQRRG